MLRQPIASAEMKKRETSEPMSRTAAAGKGLWTRRSSVVMLRKDTDEMGAAAIRRRRS